MTGFFDDNGDPQMDPYLVLKIQHTASETDVRKAYRTQMLQLHPDKLPPTLTAEELAEVTAKFHTVKDAYEFLTSAQYLTARRLYVAKMASRRAEYERREAFLRRHNSNMGSRSSFSEPMPARSYSDQMPARGNAYQQQYSRRHYSHRSMNQPSSPPRSHAVPSRRRKTESDLNWKARSEPNLNTSRRRTNEMGRRVAKEREDDINAARERGRSGAAANTHSSRRAKRTQSSKESASLHRAKSQPHSSRSKSHRSDHKRHEDASRFGTSGGGEGKENRRMSSSKPNRTVSSEEVRKSRCKSTPARFFSKSKSEKTFSTNRSARNHLPKEFFCPLTKRLMKDPVVDNDGHSFEREAIRRWLQAQNSSPITNEYLSLDMLQPNEELKRRIYKATGKPRSRSHSSRSRSKCPGSSKNSNRQLVDSYLREISSDSKLSVSLDCMGICAFSFRKLSFVVEVPSEPKTGFFVYSSFDGDSSRYISEKINAWNDWLANIGKMSRVSCVRAGKRIVFTLNGSERDIRRRAVFQKTLEYFVEMSLKLHNMLYPTETKVVEKVCLTRTPVAVA